MSLLVRKRFLVAALAFMCLTISYGPAHATLYTVDSVTDGTEHPYDTTFTTLTVTHADNSVNTYNYNSGIGSLAAAMSAVNTLGLVSTDSWAFTSAGGGVVTNPPTYVGYALSLAAGTYRITAVSGGFTYDSWGWSSSEDQRYRWLLQIMYPVGGGTYTTATLGDGATTTYANAADAAAANAGKYIDITLASAGALTFWIWDVNTMDNAGKLTFNVSSSTPLPPSLLLLLGGLSVVLVTRLRSHIHG